MNEKYQIFLISFCLLSSCSHANLKNRAYDFRDVFNIGLEKNNYGVACAMIIATGIQNAEAAEGIGLRFGHWGKYKAGGTDYIYKINKNAPEGYGTIGNSFIFISSYEHIPLENVLPRNKKKLVRETFMLKRPSSYDHFSIEMNESYSFPPFECSLGIYYGIRMGFNLHELVDFLGGLFGYDPLDDDELPNGKIRWEAQEDEKAKIKEPKEPKFEIEIFPYNIKGYERL